MKKTIAVDFGTTNSIVAIRGLIGPQVVAIEQGSTKSMVTKAFVLRNTKDHQTIIKFGLEAQEAFRLQRARGGVTHQQWRYFQSLKMLLPLSIDQFWMGNVQFSVEQIIADFLHNMLNGLEHGRVLFSIPVRYHEVDAKNTNALVRFRRIIASLGISDYDLVYEPVAALMSMRNSVPQGQTLVLDVGGGTTDAVLVTNTDGQLCVTDRAGTPIGGGLFDLQLARTVLQEHLGADRLASGYFDRFFSTDLADFNQLRSLGKISPVRTLATNGRHLGAQRLLHAIERGTVGAILDSVEQAKIALTDADLVKFTPPLVPEIEVTATYEQLLSLPIFGKLQQFVAGFVAGQKIDSVVLTGGFSKSRAVQQIVSECCPGANVITLPTSSIGLGLLSTPEEYFVS